MLGDSNVDRQLKTVFIYFCIVLIVAIVGWSAYVSYQLFYSFRRESRAEFPIPKVIVLSPPVTADVRNICMASYQQGTQPGQLNKHQCIIAYGSKTIALSQYKKLPAANYSWANYRFPGVAGALIFDGMYLPTNAVLGGQEPIVDHARYGVDPNQAIRNLYICRSVGANNFIGKVVDGVCNIAVQGKVVLATDFQVLIKP